MNVRDINFILSDASEISELIPLLTGLYFKVRRPHFQLIVYFFLISAPLKIVSLVTARLALNNMLLFHFLAICEVLFLFAFFSRSLFGKVNIGMLAVLLLINIVNSVWIERITEFNAIAWSVNTLILLCTGLFVFYRLFGSLESIHLERDPLFIMTSGWMIYFGGALFTYVFASKILSQEARGFFHNAWIIQSFSSIIKNIIVSYALWLARFP